MSAFDDTFTSLFEDVLKDLKCQPDTKAYIISIYVKYKTSDFDLSKDSVALMFAQARNKHSFYLYQNLADWIFFSNTIHPNHLKFASKEYYDTIARLSYNSCYNLINRKWQLFQELSDNFIDLEEQAKNKIYKLKF